MNRVYSFELHTYAPELNRAYINECVVPKYVPAHAACYEDHVRDLRKHLKKRVCLASVVVVKRTGATERLGHETVAVGKGQTQRMMFLKWLHAKKGIGDFVVGVDKDTKEITYEQRAFGYEIVSARMVGN